MARKGVRLIGGRELLLAGSKADKEPAERESHAFPTDWTSVRIVKRHDFDYMIYVHGSLR
jgi:hypothetical protein